MRLSVSFILNSNLDDLIAVGNYSGDGASTKTITLGYKPRAVLVSSRNIAATNYGQNLCKMATNATTIYDAENKVNAIVLSNTGFTVAGNMNINGTSYTYLAIK